MLSEAEKCFFESFTGCFVPREDASREDAFEGLAKLQGWKRGTAQYYFALSVLTKAAPKD